MYILKVYYTIHWDKTQILKKFPLNKINGTKNGLIFISWAPTHHSFTFNLHFLQELKYKVHLFKTVRGTFYHWFRFVFIKVYIFVQQVHALFGVIIPFKIEIIEKPHTILIPDLSFLSCNKNFESSSSPKTELVTNFLNLENRMFENVRFS